MKLVGRRRRAERARDSSPPLSPPRTPPPTARPGPARAARTGGAAHPPPAASPARRPRARAPSTFIFLAAPPARTEVHARRPGDAGCQHVSCRRRSRRGEWEEERGVGSGWRLSPRAEAGHYHTRPPPLALPAAAARPQPAHRAPPSVGACRRAHAPGRGPRSRRVPGELAPGRRIEGAPQTPRRARARAGGLARGMRGPLAPARPPRPRPPTARPPSPRRRRLYQCTPD